MRVPECQACSGNGAVTASLLGMERAGEECQEGLGVGWGRGPQHLNRALEEFGNNRWMCSFTWALTLASVAPVWIYAAVMLISQVQGIVVLCPLFLFSHRQPLKGAHRPVPSWQDAEQGLDEDLPSIAPTPQTQRHTVAQLPGASLWMCPSSRGWVWFVSVSGPSSSSCCFLST